MSDELTKNITWDDVKNDPNAVKVLDHGFIVLKETMGSDATIAESARVSYGMGTKTVNDDRNLIRYLVRHRHTSPLEMGEARFLVKCPILVWRQWIRHRTANVNELSARYSEMPNEYFVPEQWRGQSATNKQGSEGKIEYTPSVCGSNIMYDDDLDDLLKDPFGNICNAEDVAFREYRNRLDAGISRELARSCLPVSTYTIAYWKCDIHNLMHFLRLRLDSHAQEEIRVFAEAMYEFVKRKFPIAFEAFEDYQRQAVTFSRMEMNALLDMITGLHANANANLDGDDPIDTPLDVLSKDLDTGYGLSKREISEFKSKLQLLS
jgi:thymidylate synthase (FAD)